MRFLIVFELFFTSRDDGMHDLVANLPWTTNFEPYWKQVPKVCKKLFFSDLVKTSV